MRAAAALVLGVLLAVVVGCGSDGTIPRGSTSKIKDHLQAVRGSLDSTDCGKLQSRIDRVQSDIANLAGHGVPDRLRRNLQDGLEQLSQRAGDQCERSATQDVTTIPTPTQAPTTQSQTTGTVTQSQTTETGTGTDTTGTESVPTPTDTTPGDGDGGEGEGGTDDGGTPAPGSGGAAPTGQGGP